MAYDEGLAQRVREAMQDLGVREKSMFGGLAFMLDGHMACGISGDSLMIRVPADEHDVALSEVGVRSFDMTGRRMKGWILVDEAGHGSDAQLAAWVARSVAYVRTLPAK